MVKSPRLNFPSTSVIPTGRTLFPFFVMASEAPSSKIKAPHEEPNDDTP